WASGARPQTGCARFLTGTAVAVQSPTLDRLVNRLDEHPVLGLGAVGVALGHGLLEPPEVRLDRRGVVAVLGPLAFGAQDPLFLGVNVGHKSTQPQTPA